MTNEPDEALPAKEDRPSPPLPMEIPSFGMPDPPKVPGKHERCVHCGSITFLEKSTTLRYKCGICGKARVPVDDPKLKRSNEEKDALVRASNARNGAAAWAAAAGIAGAVGAVSLALLLLVWLAFSPGFLLTGMAFFVALLPILLAAFGASRARKKRGEIEPALVEAWQSVAQEVIDARTELTSAQLAKVLRTTPEHAETLLAHLLANGTVTSPIPDDGDVRYRSAKAPLRVAVPPEEKAKPAPASTAVKAAAEELERDRLAAEELAEEEAEAEARGAQKGSSS